MNRKKSPALTSPGKVGLLVALLLVVTGLGVSYFITGTFGLQWNWIDLAGATPSEWKFDLGAFLEEMVPLIALVALLAFASYVLVAGAVRRYQSSVSNGAEYRELLRSFKNLEDLDDERRLEELKQHPELREFVMGFKNRFAARERQLEEREKRQANASPARAVTSSDRGNGNFSSESTVLLNAIVDSKNGFAESLTLTIPELKQIERALRERLAPRIATDEPAKRELESLKASVETTLGAVRNASAAARRDAGSCVEGAREIEAQLASLKQAIDALAVPATAANGVVAAAKRVDAVAESLAQLGEEAKRVAIAAALSASGGGESDSIKVADDVRAIATRFNGVAQQWKEASPAIRSAIETIASSTVGAEKRRAAAGKALEGAAAKARLWGERVVALAEAVNGLDRAAGGSSKPVKAAAAAAAPAPAAAPVSEEWGNLNASLEEIGNETAEEPQADDTFAAPDAANADEDFVPQRAASVFEESHEDAPFTDIPGFEKEHNLFTDESGRRAKHTEHDADPRFVVEREAGGEWDLARGTQAAETEAAARKQQPGTQPTPSAPPPPAAEDDGFLTGPGAKGGSPSKAAKPAPKDSKPSRRIKIDDIGAAAPAAPMRADADADAVDLYALGAVDA